MLPVQFCNYNLDYQQRLGFLKMLLWSAQNARGGKEDVLRRIEASYAPSAVLAKGRKTHSGPAARMAGPVRVKGSFDPDVLLKNDAVPSWQSGFSFQRLDRLVLWGEMVGLLTASGRPTEWARVLLDRSNLQTTQQGIDPNPFLLSARDRAFFLALLLYHDHVLLHLIVNLARLDHGSPVDPRRACIEVIRALGETLDAASGTNLHAVRARQSLRDVLTRIALAEKLAHKGAFLNATERGNVLDGLKMTGVRNHLAEYHAVTRFEQLTDLGLFTKFDPNRPPMSDSEKQRARTIWQWYPTTALFEVARAIAGAGVEAESFLQDHWAHASALLIGGPYRNLELISDQQEIAQLLDGALPRARRQLGAVQVHTWVFIATLDALEKGLVLEFSVAYEFVDALRQDARYSAHVRLSGQQSYLGRTASVSEGSLAELTSRYPLGKTS